jgi:hypothetical protein
MPETLHCITGFSNCCFFPLSEWGSVQVGADPLGASTSKGKLYKVLEPEMSKFGLSEAQRCTAKALCKLTKVGPKAACCLSQRFKSLGDLMVFFRTMPKVAAVAEIAELKKGGGCVRNIGPMIAEHLHRFFTTDNGSEVFAET